jgi:hypothetical protein
MKRLKCCFVSTGFLIPLFWGTMAIAQTDLLKLDSYKEGDIPSYGENIVVKQDEKTSIKWISQGVDTIGSATIKFPMNLSGDFELFIQIYSAGNEVMLLSSDEYRIKLDWYYDYGRLDYLAAGKDRVSLDQGDASKNGINKIRFSVVNNVAKVYMNDVFDGKITLKPDLVYTQLIIQDIKEKTQIYALTSSGSPTTDNTQNSSTSNDCMATYSLNGQMHIPCVTVPNPFGGTSVYDITMQKQSNGFVFNLDMNSIKPR